MSDTSHRASSANPAANATVDHKPSIHPDRDILGAARAEEHGAPAPSVTTAPKLLVIAALITLAIIAAYAFA